MLQSNLKAKPLTQVLQGIPMPNRYTMRTTLLKPSVLQSTAVPQKMLQTRRKQTRRSSKSRFRCGTTGYIEAMPFKTWTSRPMRNTLRDGPNQYVGLIY